jgi:hypothetical protein
MTAEVQPSELGPFHPVSDATVLAAIERAQRHVRGGDELGAAWHDIAEHLGFVREQRMTRMLRPQVNELIAAGFLEATKARGFAHWRVTDAGRKRLLAAKRSGDAPLPESPQHRLWRHARAEARARGGTLTVRLGDTLREATQVLNSRQHGNSAAWSDLAVRLSAEGTLLASVLYCGREWAEPDDALAIDEESKRHALVLERSGQ